MKTMDEELKTMFGETPDSFRLAVQRAVDKKEAQPMKKRMTVRAILIAAVVIVATMAVAYAVGTGMGLTDFLGIFHENVQVPSGVKQVLDSTVQQHWQVGPLTLTLNCGRTLRVPGDQRCTNRRHTGCVHHDQCRGGLSF